MNSSNILSERLERLLRYGIIKQVPAADGSWGVYVLSEKGKALGPILRAMRNWGLKWEPGKQVLLAPH